MPLKNDEKSLEIKDLKVTVESKPILKGVTITLEPGKVYALMGPNGSGKSTLAQTIMGHPKYKITGGTIRLNQEDLASLSPDEKAQRGLFLSFQYPKEISGVSLSSFLRAAYNAVKKEKLSVLDFHKRLKEKLCLLKLPENFSARSVNEGFSGGEKKKAEMVQMLVLDPAFAILDETDSGLDVDALKAVAAGINLMRSPQRSILLITHYYRILDYVNPDIVYVMIDGKIVKTGGKELAQQIEKQGFGGLA